MKKNKKEFFGKIFTSNYLKKHKTEYLFLTLILTFSALFRLYRLDKLLGFWYDQGRDALVIWDLIHYRKFFLIGPVTGIEGIFLGPFYYYLLTPFYWIGKGNPVAAAAGLAWLSVGAVFLVYLLGKKIYNYKVGLVAALFYGFSYSVVTFSRWLSNPNPLPFFTLLAILLLWKFVETKNVEILPFFFFIIGLCLQLEAASAVFFLPSIFFILVWQRKNLKTKWLVLGILAFLLTLVPQIVFDIRHERILTNSFKKFLIEEKSFKFSISNVFYLRLLTYYNAIVGSLIASSRLVKFFALFLFFESFWLVREKIFSPGGKLLCLWLFIPLVGYLFYQGNHGYLWDYYFCGIIPAFIILFAAGLVFLSEKNILSKIVILVFLFLFLWTNLRDIKNYLKAGIGIKLEAQKKAIDWIYQKAGGRPFNADFYVPPQIYYTYSYLMKWYGKQKYGYEPSTKTLPELYTLYEPDPDHPQFLKNWLERQDRIGKIIEEYSWGDITVQKRERSLNE